MVKSVLSRIPYREWTRLHSIESSDSSNLRRKSDCVIYNWWIKPTDVSSSNREKKMEERRKSKTQEWYCGAFLRKSHDRARRILCRSFVSLLRQSTENIDRRGRLKNRNNFFRSWNFAAIHDRTGPIRAAFWNSDRDAKQEPSRRNRRFFESRASVTAAWRRPRERRGRKSGRT